MKKLKIVKEIKCQDAPMVFARVLGISKQNFLLESKDVSHIYGRLSLIGIDPVLEIKGKNEDFEIKALNKRGCDYLDQLRKNDLRICDSLEVGKSIIKGVIKKSSDSDGCMATRKSKDS